MKHQVYEANPMQPNMCEFTLAQMNVYLENPIGHDIVTFFFHLKKKINFVNLKSELCMNFKIKQSVHGFNLY